MSRIKIRQANITDITIIESILLNTVNWLNEINRPMWSVESVKWKSLSESYDINDFYIAFFDDKPYGCMVIVNTDPFFFPDVPKGESLFLHKLAVVKDARKLGVSQALIEHFKEKGREVGATSVQLETHALRPKLRAFYENNGFKFVEIKTWSSDKKSAYYIYKLA